MGDAKVTFRIRLAMTCQEGRKRWYDKWPKKGQLFTVMSKYGFQYLNVVILQFGMTLLEVNVRCDPMGYPEMV